MEYVSVGISFVALVVSIISFRMSRVTKLSDDRRLALSELRAALAHFQKEALKHLFIPGVSGAERDVLALHEEAVFALGQVEFEDVRQATELVLARCLKVIDLRKREPPYEEKEALTEAIEDALRAADELIVARMKERPRRGLVARSKRP